MKLNAGSTIHVDFYHLGILFEGAIDSKIDANVAKGTHGYVKQLTVLVYVNPNYRADQNSKNDLNLSW